MIDTYKISVVLAVYNGAETIDRAIRSILAQTHKAHEIIVVDDGSTDGTAKKLEAFGNKIIYVYQENSGVSAARNRGAQEAGGNWLSFLDADDWYLPNRLRYHAQLLKMYPDVDFLTGNFEYRNAAGELLGLSMEKSKAGRTLLARNKSSPLMVMARGDFPDFIETHFGDTHTLSVKKEDFFSLRGYSPNYQVCEDVHLLIRLCAVSGSVGVCADPMAVYYVHDDSLTRSDPLRAQAQTVDALTALKAEFRDLPKDLFSGLKRSIRRARLDLAYVLLRTGHKQAAIRAVAPIVLENPSLRSIKDVLSVVAG